MAPLVDTLPDQHNKELPGSREAIWVTNALPALVAYITPDHHYRFVNETYKRFFAKAPEDVVGLHVRDFLGPDVYARIYRHLERAAMGEVVAVEIQLRNHLGELRQFRGTYTPDFGPDGDVRGIVVLQNDVTELKKTERTLQDREAQLKLALDAARLGTCDVNLKTRTIIWDKRHRDIFGLADGPNQLPIHEYLSFVHSEDRSAFQNLIESTIASGGDRFEIEFRIQVGDAEVKWIQSMGRLIYDESGDAVRIIGVAADITGRKLFEEKLKESEGKIRELFERMPQIIWKFTPGGKPVYANARSLEYSGVDIVSGESDRWMCLLHPDELGHIKEMWNECLITGTPFESEYRLRSANGSFRWFLVRAAPTRDGRGRVHEWLGTATDIHDRKIAEERQKRMQKKVLRLQAVANQLARVDSPYEIARIVIDEGLEVIKARAGGVAVIDESKKGQLFHMQHTHVLHMLYSRDQDSGQRSGEASFSWRGLIMDAIRSKEAIFIQSHEELKQLYPAIAEADIDRSRQAIAILPLFMHGEALGAFGLSFDSEQSFSPERKSYLAILAEQCAQAIERARLFEAEKAARESAEIASKAKSQFLANMSHEIRTPMNAILGFTDLLGDRTLAEDEREDYRRRIRLNGDQLLHLIDDVLDLSKIEAGRLDLERVEFSVADLIKDVHESLSVMIKGKKIQPRLVIDNEVPEAIKSDPVRIRQILTNLLSNAAKFTAHGFIETRVSKYPGAQEPSLMIEVEDSGAGIAPEFHQNLFKPFAQGDGSITRRFGGTGLGLALSRRFAEALGGRLELIHSASGQGSIFRVILPIGDEYSYRYVKRSSNGHSDVKPAVANEALAGARILLAEDSPDNEALIRAYLKHTGVKLAVAHDGIEALEMALEGNFDMVLMDIQMPRMDGLEATRRLREKNYDRPIVALSAHALVEEVRRSLAAGCQAHLTKPVTRASLIEGIKEALGR